MLRRIALATLLFAVLAPAADAATAPLARYRTPGCPGAPVWRIGYRLYWTDDHGRTASKAGYAQVLDHARAFAEKVGPASGCAVRVQVDVYEEPRRWPATGDWKGYPKDTPAFQLRHGYDAVFVRFPEIGDEGYSGVAHGGLPLDMRAKFPGSANPLTNWGAVEPEAGTLWHEWLHLVVGFYKTPRLGRPKGDVHGACAHAYPEACVKISEAYFADMMTGRVQEQHGPKGLLPREWAFYGTPAHPRHQDPGLYVRVGIDGGSVGWTAGVRRVVLTYTDASTGQLAYRENITGGAQTLLPPVPSGLYRVCVASAASVRFRSGRTCDRYRVRYDSAQASNWRLAHGF